MKVEYLYSKICPVCGGKVIFNTYHVFVEGWYKPFCEKCGATNSLDWRPVEELTDERKGVFD